ncbi:hypothetical protein VNO78_05927 [Psophocarpus tetragonolobus]|uniref:Condensin complex subunit 2 n=1 Tax=Psophocarpus tetragonolobus TaxID=3891 RepID=A0AAN9XR82_PSOTE
MAETLSPNPAMGQKPRLRIQSPTSPFFLRSNDDQLERAQARAARAAAIRRRSISLNHPLQANSDPCLNKQQILDLFQNCIKLASENKINQKNTWELNLIDHLTDIIKAEEENDAETNFQKASCTLEAGVKIYSLRVDSVHSEAYKVLGGMNRAGQEAEQDTTLDGVNIANGEEESRKETSKKLSPLSTLESSVEALNVKKFDAAFVVDPLYRQTTAKFDEGGAKGLLMNNLGVYGGCRVLFDSQEVPAKCMASQNQSEISDTIDLSFVKDCIEQMVLDMRVKDEISPTLRTIVNQFDESNRRPTDVLLHGQNTTDDLDATFNDENGFDREYENGASWSDDHDDQAFVADLGCQDADPTFPSYPQDNGEPFPSPDADMDDRFENVDGYLFLSLGFSSKQNAWAGPDHWKYRKSKVSEVHPTTEDGETVKSRQPKSKKQAEVDLNFTNSLEKNMLDVFSPPKNPKSLLLPESRLSCNTKLPEDCHYQPEDLVKLFLLSNVKCLGRRANRFSDGSREQSNEYESFPSWDNGSVCEDDSGDYGVDFHSDMEDSNTLITQPRQVNKIEVQYDKTSKQVDVHALKITLWDHVQESVKLPVQGQKEDTLSFRNILANFPSECNAAATISDISPHLCFICLLHLANEKGLSIQSSPNLDDLAIHLPHVDSIRGTV